MNDGFQYNWEHFLQVFFLNDNWHAIGSSEVFGIKIIAKGSKQICLAKADDFLGVYETYENAYKSKKWLNEPASSKQLNLLPQIYRSDFGITKYKAANLLKFHFNKQAIKSLLLDQPQMSNALWEFVKFVTEKRKDLDLFLHLFEQEIQGIRSRGSIFAQGSVRKFFINILSQTTWSI